MTKPARPYTLHRDGSVTFHGEVTDDIRARAYAEAARTKASQVRPPGPPVERAQAEQVIERQTATPTTAEDWDD